MFYEITEELSWIWAPSSLWCEPLAQDAQRSCGCPWILGGVQGQAGQSLEQPGTVEGVLAHGRGGTG